MCPESKAREPKWYLSSRPDKAIGYTVRKYCAYSIGLHCKIAVSILACVAELAATSCKIVTRIAVHCDDFLGLASWISVSEGRAHSCSSGHCKQTVVVEDPIQAVESLFVLLS